MKKVTSYHHACEIIGRDPQATIDVSAIEPEDQQAFIDLFELTIIIKANNLLNEWEADWSDLDQLKYYPWADVVADVKKPSGFGLSYFDFVYSDSFTHVGSRLVVGTREECKYIFEDFVSKYESWMLKPKTK